MTTLSIATSFSKTPAGRYLDDGPYSGERFREEFLLRELKGSETVTIVLDGAAGYPSSFLEEAFGGLVRKGYFTADQLRRKIRVVANEKGYKAYTDAIWQYIEQAKPEPTHA